MAILTENPNFVDGDAITADIINDVIDTAINANKLTQSPDTSNIGNVGNPTVTITSDGRFKFSNLKGEKGEQGIQGEKGEPGNGSIYEHNISLTGYLYYDVENPTGSTDIFFTIYNNIANQFNLTTLLTYMSNNFKKMATGSYDDSNKIITSITTNEYTNGILLSLSNKEFIIITKSILNDGFSVNDVVIRVV